MDEPGTDISAEQSTGLPVPLDGNVGVFLATPNELTLSRQAAHFAGPWVTDTADNEAEKHDEHTTS